MGLLIGLLEIIRARPDGLLCSLLVLVSIFTLRYVLHLRYLLLPNTSLAPELYKGRTVFGSHQFTTSRAEFIKEGTKQSRNGLFSFWYGRNHVVVLSGESARTGFLTSRGLDPGAGFTSLFGTFLNVDELTSSNLRKATLVYKRCTQDDHLAMNLHHLVTDTDASLRKIGVANVIDPLKFAELLIYQLTHRMAGVHDIANDPKLLRETLAVYGPLEDSAYIDVLFPWLPTPSKLRKIFGYAKLHFTIKSVVKKRRITGKTDTDMLQKAMDEGFSDVMISLIVIGAILAGVFNTTLATMWNLCCLAENPDRLDEVRSEIVKVVKKYRLSESECLVNMFQRLSLKDWETEFPVLQLTIKESIRFTMAGAVVRKNISNKDLVIGKTRHVIPKNSLAVHATADAHMNEEIYTEPWKWDPRRFSEARAEGANIPHSYLGWGSGNHPCPARRFAELNVVVANVLFIASYDFYLCNKEGQKTSDPLPDLDFNRMGAGRPTAEVYLKCQTKNLI